MDRFLGGRGSTAEEAVFEGGEGLVIGGLSKCDSGDEDQGIGALLEGRFASPRGEGGSDG